MDTTFFRLDDAGGPKLVFFGFQQANENFHDNSDYMKASV